VSITSYNCLLAASVQVAWIVAVKVPLVDVEKEWQKESAARHIQTLAEHYGVYQDLFNGDYFTPVVNLHVCYDYDDDLVTPVYYGNRIFPAEVAYGEFSF